MTEEDKKKLKKLNVDIKALGESIEHWQRMVTGEDGDCSPGACALCKLYISTCFGCPVHAYTGRGGCSSTPHVAYERAAAGGKTAPHEAQAEVNFLQKLRKNAVSRRKRLLARKGKK